MKDLENAIKILFEQFHDGLLTEQEVKNKIMLAVIDHDNRTQTQPNQIEVPK